MSLRMNPATTPHNHRRLERPSTRYAGMGAFRMLQSSMCEQCEWENTMPDLAILVDKYQDWLDTADDWTEKNIVSEILDDLKALAHG